MVYLIGFIDKFGGISGKRLYFVKLDKVRVEEQITLWCRNKASCFSLNDPTLFEQAVRIKNDNKTSIVDNDNYVEIHGLSDGLALLTIDGDQVVSIQGIDVNVFFTKLKKLAEGESLDMTVDNKFLEVLKGK